jgi:molybdopterin synthase catalytic subunit
LRRDNPRIGAVASFIGVCRDANDGDRIATMTLEHYPGMTEKALETIVAEAKQRWNVMDVLVIHRVGELKPTDQIVLVVVTGAHRGEAFAACEFVMDYLKTRAPFWKKEQTPQGGRWVEARASDDDSAQRWQNRKSDAV